MRDQLAVQAFRPDMSTNKLMPHRPGQPPATTDTTKALTLTRPTTAPSSRCKMLRRSSSLDALQQEVTKLREQMAVIKQEVSDEINSKWVSPWQTTAIFELKVKTRLTGHQEYRSLQNRVRDAQASLPGESDAATGPPTIK